MAEEKLNIILIILSTQIVLSIIGNILVVVISVFFMRLRSLTIIFILNMALSDLLFTVGLLFWICKQIWGLPHGACQVFNILFSAGFSSSILFLVLISVQHYVTVVHPHTGWKKGHWITHVVICVWMMSISAALPATELCIYETAFLAYKQNITYKVILTTYKENIIFVCAFLFMAFCYIRILQTILKSPTNQRHRTTGLAFFLVATFFICWAPYNIVKFLSTLSDYPKTLSSQSLEHPDYSIYICSVLAFTRCCLSPVISGLYALRFRKTARENIQWRATLKSAQTATEEHYYDSIVNVNTEIHY